MKTVIADMGKHKSNGYKNPALISKILYLYIDMMMEQVLLGNRAIIPGFGTIYVAKEVLSEPKRWKSITRKIVAPERRFMDNPRRRGFNYCFVIESEMLKEYRYTCVIAPKWRDRLHTILMETDQDYPIFQSAA